MILKISLTLLLCTLTTLAKPNPPSSYTDTAHGRAGCHEHRSPNYAMITFYDNDSPTFHYAIITRYKSFYPTLLRYALQAERYQLTSPKIDEQCGWWKAASVHGRMGLESKNHRGDIY